MLVISCLPSMLTRPKILHLLSHIKPSAVQIKFGDVNIVISVHAKRPVKKSNRFGKNGT